MTTFAIGLGRADLRRRSTLTIGFRPAEQGPDDADRFVGHCHQDHIARTPSEHGLLPFGQAVLPAPGPAQTRSCPVHQQLAQVAIAAL